MKPAMAASGGPTGRPFRRPPTCSASGPSPEWRFLRWANRAAFSEATDLFRFRAIPGVEVSTKLFLICEGCRYDITSVEDVKGRGMYVEILAKKVVAANG